MEGLVVKYDSMSKPVLHGISFYVPPRTKVGIVGRTGAGKSSLISAIFRLVEPKEGKIIIDGVDILKMALHDLRSRLSIVPQEPILFRGTIRSNMDPFEMYTDSEIWTALSRAHLKEVIKSAGGLSATVREGGSNFSVGQRQLLCLARAVIRDNALLVMDEATANVDPDTDALIQQTLREEFDDRSVLCIAHRLNTVVYYDKILVLDHGRIAEYDSPRALVEKNGMFRSMCENSGQFELLRSMMIA